MHVIAYLISRPNYLWIFGDGNARPLSWYLNLLLTHVWSHLQMCVSMMIMGYGESADWNVHNLWWIAGPPGSGKGTQSPIIKDEYCLCHLATGDMLRTAVAAKTPLVIKAKEAMDKVNVPCGFIFTSIIPPYPFRHISNCWFLVVLL